MLTACGGGSDSGPSGVAGHQSSADGPGSGVSAPAPSSGGAPTSNQGQNPMGILVPAYFSGGSSSPWDGLIAARKNFPNIPITAILNPTNGNFTKADPGLLSAIASFTAVGGKVVGYVETEKGGLGLTAVERNIDNYVKYYGSNVTGVFLDEMGGDQNELPFYQSVASYVRGTYPGMEIIGNPGTYPTSGYANVADILVIFENPMSSWGEDNPKNSPWVYKRSNSGQAIIAYSASCSDMQMLVGAAATATFNVGWIYATDDNGSNPWDRLPSYWTQLLGTVNAINGNQSSAPAC